MKDDGSQWYNEIHAPAAREFFYALTDDDIYDMVQILKPLEQHGRDILADLRAKKCLVHFTREEVEKYRREPNPTECICWMINDETETQDDEPN
jgi:hypothetical protein